MASKFGEYRAKDGEPTNVIADRMAQERLAQGRKTAKAAE